MDKCPGVAPEAAQKAADRALQEPSALEMRRQRTLEPWVAPKRSAERSQMHWSSDVTVKVNLAANSDVAFQV
jgi:hypothetical protein